MLALCTGVNLIPPEYQWSMAKTQQQYNHLSLKDTLTLSLYSAVYIYVSFFHVCIMKLGVCFASENAVQIKCRKQFIML